MKITYGHGFKLSSTNMKRTRSQRQVEHSNTEESGVASKTFRSEQLSKEPTFFEGVNLYVLDVAMGKRKAALFRSRCVKFGANLCSSMIEASHIAIDQSLNKERLTQILRNENVTFAELKTTKVVTSEWLTQCLKQKMAVDTTSFEIEMNAQDFESQETDSKSWI